MNRIIKPSDRFIGIYSDPAVQLDGYPGYVKSETEISGFASITFSDNADLLAQGSLSGSADISFSSSAVLNGNVVAGDAFTTPQILPAKRFNGLYSSYAVQLEDFTFGESATAIQGVDGLTFTLTGDLLAAGELVGATSITFSDSADLDGVTSLSGATTLSLSATGNAFTTTGSLEGSAGMVFSPVAFLRGTADISGSTDLTFDVTGSANTPSGVAIPVHTGTLRVYQATAQAASFEMSALAARYSLSGSTSIGFTNTADLTTTSDGAITGIVSLTFSQVAGNLRAKGELGTVTEVVAFTPTGTLTNAAASQVFGTASIAFTDGADLTADGELVGSTDITFSEVARLTSGAISGTASIRFTPVATGIRKRSAAGTAAITFTPAGDGRRLGGESISGSTVVLISGTATPRFGALGRIEFSVSGNLTLAAGNWNDQAGDGSIWTVQSLGSTTWTEAA